MELITIITILGLLYLFIFNPYKEEKEQPKPSYIPDNVTTKENQTYLRKLFINKKLEYLKSDTWHQKQRLALARDNHTCTSCGSTKNLHVHHDAGYNLIPNEPIEDLRTLCNICHKAFHDTHGYPNTITDYLSWDTRNIVFINKKETKNGIITINTSSIKRI